MTKRKRTLAGPLPVQPAVAPQCPDFLARLSRWGGRMAA